MNGSQWRRIEELYHRLLEIDTSERAAFLAERCADDDTVRAELEALLESHESESAFLDVPALGEGFLTHVAELEGEDVLIGRTLGPYRVEGVIASGGMGTVYAAERDDEEFQQPVAIKVIRCGMATPELRRRFRKERQALASLDHPGIAHLIDGGTTPDGSPFLVMDRIEGDPIDTWCDQRGLPVPDRLRLFLRVCDAVQFAHRRLVIHRDIKPPNILVTQDGHPRLLDFGVAKILTPDQDEEGTGTVGTGRFFTPGYASPEQVRGETISTATDLYSLGVVLFELLTGHRPFPLGTKTPRELERAICEEAAPRPSQVIRRSTVATRLGEQVTITLSDVSTRRGVRPDRLVRMLAGDLDHIVGKALRKEPDRRYASVDEFAADIRRHIEGLPVEARRGTMRYRTGKFLRRHHKGVLATLLVVASLVAGLITTRHETARARNAAEIANRQAQAARRARKFIVDQLGALDPFTGALRREEVRRTLEESAELGLRDLVGEPEEQVAYLEAVAGMSEQFHLPRESVRWWGRVAEIAASAENEIPRMAEVRRAALHRQGRAHLLRGEWADAGRALGEAFELGPPSHENSAIELDLARVARGRGQFADGARLARTAGARTSDSGLKSEAAHLEADLLTSAGHGLLGASVARRALARLRQEEDPDLLWCARLESVLGLALLKTPRRHEAELHVRRALDLAPELVSEDDPLMHEFYAPLVGCLIGRGELATSNLIIRDQLARAERVLGQDSLATADWTAKMAEQQAVQASHPVAEIYSSLALDRYRTIGLDLDDPRVVETESRRAVVRLEWALRKLPGRMPAVDLELVQESQAYFRARSEQVSSGEDVDHWRTARLEGLIGATLASEGQWEAGISAIERAIVRVGKSLGEDHPEVADLYRLRAFVDEHEFPGRPDSNLAAGIERHMNRWREIYRRGSPQWAIGAEVATFASIDFDDDFIEWSTVLDDPPPPDSTAQLWVYARARSMPGVSFRHERDLVLMVNDSSEHVLRTNVPLLLENNTWSYQWVPIEIPTPWLHQGENRFLFVKLRRDVGWETNSVEIAVDPERDEDRSWWFGNGQWEGRPAVRNQDPDDHDQSYESDMVLTDPTLLSPGRAAARDACHGELIMELRVHPPRGDRVRELTDAMVWNAAESASSRRVPSMRHCCLAIALALFQLSCTSPDSIPVAAVADTTSTPEEPGWRSEIERQARPLLDAKLVPGLVVGIYDDGDSEVHGFGRIDPGASEVPGGRTIYEIGSITKVFTGILLADAAGQEGVELDSPLSALLPEGVKAPKFGGAEITLRHLATHRSGLPRVPPVMAVRGINDPYSDYDAVKLYAFIDSHELTAAPGDTYGYSNLGMGLLGQLLAEEADTTYPKLLERRISAPLGLSDTTVALSRSQRSRFAPGHREGVAMQPWRFDALCGCGGVRSTVNDLLRFIEAAIELDSSPLRRSFETAAKRQTPNMGLGWHYAGDGFTLWHNGQTGGYSSGLFLSTKHRKGVVVLANGASSEIDGLAERLIQSLYGMSVDPPPVRKAKEVDVTAIEKLVGVYSSTAGFTITASTRAVAGSETGLFVQLTGQPTWRVYPESDTRFFYRVVEAELSFELDETGDRAVAVVLHQGGRATRCARDE